MIFILTPILGTIGVGLALSVGSILALMSMFLAVKGELILKLPTAKILQSILMGLSLLLLSFVLQEVLGDKPDIKFVLFKLFCLGTVFLCFEYLLLRSLFSRPYKYE